MTERLLVLLHDRVVGHLERPDAASGPSFSYTRGYVADGAVSLSARLPLRIESFPAERVTPFLEGLLPENPQTRELWARQLGTEPGDAFAILAAMGWDCPGAVQFCREGDIDELRHRSGDHRPIDESEIAHRLRRLHEEPASWSLPDEHWSLGGQQQKFALSWLRGGWHEATGSAATTHIIKPGIHRLHHQALVEHATMEAATSSGIEAAGTRFAAFEDQWALVVERFDRATSPTGSVMRFHQEDFCQALGRSPQHKYEARGGPTLADLVRVTRREASRPDDDILALGDFLVINLIAGAPDGHAKNVSLLRTTAGVWVAPLYDLATGLAYDAKRVDRSVALSIGGERQVSRIGPRQWRRAAETLGVDVERIAARASQLASTFPGAFARALESLGDAPGRDEVAGRCLPSLTAHCRRVTDSLP